MLRLNAVSIHRDGPILDLGSHTLEFAPGTLTLILGECGAGKSTLLQAAAGLLAPDSGSVEVTPVEGAGASALSGSREIRRLKAGYLTAQPEEQLFADSVEEELAYSLRGGTGKLPERSLRVRLIREALTDAGLPADDGFLARSPFSLSGGQKRRLALAGTLLLQPDWLFLDEPSTGLDAEGKESLRGVLTRFRASRAGGILIAGHEADFFLPLADRVLLLRQGRLLFDGRPQEIWQTPGLLTDAGLAWPETLRVACGLEAAGFVKPDLRESEEETVDRLARELLGKASSRGEASCGVHPAGSTPDGEETIREWAPYAPDPAASDSNSPKESGQRPPFMKRFDPRAQWVFALALSVGVWLQRDWIGAAAGLVLTLAAIRLFGVPLSVLWRTSRYYAWLAVATALVAGLTWKAGGASLGPFGFSLSEAGESFRRLFVLYLILWLGLLFPLSVSQLELKRVVRQALRPFSKRGWAVEAVSLGMMLLFRYVTLIGELWTKYARLADIRRAGGQGKRRLRDLRPLLIPFFLSILQLGEQTAFALEARGYPAAAADRREEAGPKLSGSDLLLMAIGIGISCALIFARRGLRI